jgi:hypothetical protein
MLCSFPHVCTSVPWFHAEGARQGGRTPLYAYLTRAVGKGRKSGKVAKYKFFIECPERDSSRVRRVCVCVCVCDVCV